MIFQYWGATAEEINSSVVGDDLCSDATVVATRSITIGAAPQEVFPWIRQMGFGRAGWYSYDWLDNLGRKSASTIHDEWQSVEAGDKIPSGPISFIAAIVDAPRHFVLEIKSPAKKSPGKKSRWVRCSKSSSLDQVMESCCDASCSISKRTSRSVISSAPSCSACMRVNLSSDE
jgi:hypothetical protein